MSEFETEPNTQLGEYELDPIDVSGNVLIKPDPQLALAEDLNITWEFEGQKYAQMVANRTGNVGTTIMHPTTGKPIAIIQAEFAWTDGQAFLNHLNLNIRDEKSAREEESIRKKANVVSQNAKLFKDLVQRGSLTKIDAQGERTNPANKTHSEMCEYAPELQSQLIDDWLGNFHIERYFPEGTDDVDSILSGSDSIHFLARVGNYKSPAHILIFEFNAPSPDARRAYENDTFLPGSKQDGEKTVSTYNINHKTKLNFARRYFKDIKGVVLCDSDELDVDMSLLYPFEGKPEQVTAIRDRFNPHWFIRLADHLAESFNFAGK